MLSCESLQLQIDQNSAIDHFSMTLLPGAIVSVYGDNFSAKKKLLHTLCGINTNYLGAIYIQQIDIVNLHKPYAVYIDDELSSDNCDTVIENIQFWSRLYNKKFYDDTLHCATIKYWGLEDYLHTKLSILPNNVKFKALLSRLMISPLNLWLIDNIIDYLEEDDKSLFMNLVKIKAESGGIVILCQESKSADRTIANIDINDYIH